MPDVPSSRNEILFANRVWLEVNDNSETPTSANADTYTQLLTWGFRGGPVETSTRFGEGVLHSRARGELRFEFTAIASKGLGAEIQAKSTFGTDNDLPLFKWRLRYRTNADSADVFLNFAGRLGPYSVLRQEGPEGLVRVSATVTLQDADGFSDGTLPDVDNDERE